MPINMSQLNNEEATSSSEARGASDVLEIVQKNLELTEQVLEMTKKLDGYRKWQQVYGVIKVFIFVVPIVLSIMYLPALLNKALEPYNELLNVSQQTKQLIPTDAGELLKTLKGMK